MGMLYLTVSDQAQVSLQLRAGAGRTANWVFRSLCKITIYRTIILPVVCMGVKLGR